MLNLTFKDWIAVLSLLVAFVSYVIYFKQIFGRRIKPHAFSWLIWGFLTGIAFVAGVIKGGGAGMWVSGFTALACFVIAGISFFRGDVKFVLFDWISLIAAIVAIILWWLSKEPTTSVILVTIIDFIACFPTYRKSWYKPYDDSATLFALASLKFAIAFFALDVITINTALHSTSLIFTNGAIVVLLLTRRKFVKA